MTSARVHTGLAAMALLLGVLAAVNDAPVPDETPPASITALELARWIRAGKPGLHVIDVRDTRAYETFAIPGAERVALGRVGARRWESDETVVAYGDDEDTAVHAAVALRRAGVRSALVLRGGIDEWARTIASPTLPAHPSPEAAAASREIAELSRWFGGVPRVGDAGPSGSDSLRASLARIRRRGC